MDVMIQKRQAEVVEAGYIIRSFSWDVADKQPENPLAQGLVAVAAEREPRKWKAYYEDSQECTEYVKSNDYAISQADYLHSIGTPKQPQLPSNTNY